jgi:pSer/pThr/pTyr-binding forkhead associated (FHA) protein
MQSMNLVLTVVSSPDSSERKYQLVSDRAFVAGRAHDGECNFAADERMSSSHFSLALTGQGCFLTDLASANGTYVNGTRVVHCQIFPGDCILAGQTLFRLDQEGSHSADTYPSSGETVVADVSRNQVEVLTITTDSGLERTLVPGQRISIGRTDLAEWVFPKDAMMSSEHMAIWCHADQWNIEDLSSSNGTYLNGQRITHSKLKAGDRVTAGKTQFSIAITKPDQGNVVGASIETNQIKPASSLYPSPDPVSDARDLEPQHIPANPSMPASAPIAFDTKPAFRVTLRCLTQPDLTADFIPGESFVIGRGFDADISAPQDFSLSSSHAQIQVFDHRVLLRDLDSTNGTKVNGQRVRETDLAHDDELCLGSQVFRVEFSDATMVDRSMVDRSRTVHVTYVSPPQDNVVESVIVKNPSPILLASQSEFRQPLTMDDNAPMAESDIPFESFPCGSGLYFFVGCIPAFDPIDVARRLTLATPGWLIQQDERNDKSVPQNESTPFHMERLSPMDPSWMIPWSQSWGKQSNLIVYSRSDADKIHSTFDHLFQSLDGTKTKFPSHLAIMDFLTNRLKDTVHRVFAPLDAVLLELYGGKQWAYVASRDLESVLPKLHFRKKYRW